MNKILLIKLGALGDVVRTTSILRALKGEITWVTLPVAMPLLENNPFVHKVLDIRKCADKKFPETFDLVLCLDEERPACELATRVKKKELVGTYLKDGRTLYTDSAAEWFDMSLISRFGREAADRRKWENRKAYQEILFNMIGKKFKGEEYVLPVQPAKEKTGVIGLETRSGDRWVGKRWKRFDEFCRILRAKQMPYTKFKQHPTLRGYLDSINQTDLVVTTDSLALHLALGLRKKVVCLFTITSPAIYPNRMIRVVNPKLEHTYQKKTMAPSNSYCRRRFPR